MHTPPSNPEVSSHAQKRSGRRGTAERLQFGRASGSSYLSRKKAWRQAKLAPAASSWSRPAEQRPRNHNATKRSEEHTSELQSLMRISYAVFCLKKKKDTTQP